MKEFATKWADEQAVTNYDLADCTEEGEERDERKEPKEEKKQTKIEDVTRAVWLTIKGAAQECAATIPRTSNRLLFRFARYICAAEQRCGAYFSPQLLRRMFDLWERLSANGLRPQHDYYSEFLQKMLLVRKPIGQELAGALVAARKRTPSQRAVGNERLQLMACLCAELQERKERGFLPRCSLCCGFARAEYAFDHVHVACRTPATSNYRKWRSSVQVVLHVIVISRRISGFIPLGTKLRDQ
jgi:hypothetical protein